MALNESEIQLVLDRIIRLRKKLNNFQQENEPYYDMQKRIDETERLLDINQKMILYLYDIDPDDHIQ